MDDQQQPPPFGPPDPYAAWQPSGPQDPYAAPRGPLAAPPVRRPSQAPYVVIGVVIALVAVTGLVTAAARWTSDRLDRSGVFQTVASCGAVVDDGPLLDAATHSDGVIAYGPQPPSYGTHNPVPLPPLPRVVSLDTAPPLAAERAVHNLEHAYVVVWYDDPDDEAVIASALSRVDERKLLAVPWMRAPFENDARFVLTAWGHRQACTSISSSAIESFFASYGGFAGDAPEKSAI
jgi:hypothetical protein